MILEPYLYTTDPIVEFTLTPFEVVPSACEVTYTCQTIGGPKLFPCTWELLENFGKFDSETGNYKLMQTDMVEFPAGDYTLEITGTVGTKSDSFELTL